MSFRTLSMLGVAALVSVAASASAAPQIQFDDPVTVLREASKGVKFVSQTPCLSGRNFYRFTNGPARRVTYRHAYGTSEAVFTCRNNRRMWIKIFPRGRNRVRFMSHGATVLVAQIKRGNQWVKVCEGRYCRGQFPDVDPATIAAWRNLDYTALKRFGRRFRNSHAATSKFRRRPVGKPLFRRGRAPLPVVVFQPHKRYQVIWPDGSRAKRLGITGAFRYGSTSRGGAVDKPLVSPDGRWLADLVSGSLRITSLRTGKSRLHKFARPRMPRYRRYRRRGRRAHVSHVLIGPWAPDSSALMVAVGRDLMILDLRTGKTTKVDIRDTWGSSGHQLLRARGSAIVATDLKTRRSRQLGTVARPRVWMLRARRGTVVMRSRHQGQSELHIVYPNGKTKPLITKHLTAGSYKLSPSGRKLAAVLRDPKDRTRSYLTVIDTRSNKRRRLTRCSTLCNFYWYTDKTLVIETHREVSMLHVDGREYLLHRDARLVRMRSHR